MPRFQKRELNPRAVMALLKWEGCASSTFLREWFATDNGSLRVALGPLFAKGEIGPVVWKRSIMWTIMTGARGRPNARTARTVAVTNRSKPHWVLMQKQARVYAEIDGLRRTVEMRLPVTVDGKNRDAKQFPNPVVQGRIAVPHQLRDGKPGHTVPKDGWR